MTFELLVEIPEVVEKIFHLGTSASNLGLRSPTILALKGSIALINGESGALYKKYSLPNSNAIIEDCVYVPGSRCFVIALADNTILTVPESSKSPSECEVEKWPYQPRSLISLKDNELVVYCEGGFISQVSMKDNKVKAPLQTPNKLLPTGCIDGSDFCVGNKTFIALCFSSKRSSKSPIENGVTLFQCEPIATGTSSWLDSSSATNLTLNNHQNSTIVSVVADDQSGSISLALNKDSESFWIKLDSTGSELFHRKLSFSPKQIFCWGGVVWFYDGACSLNGCNNRFGNALKSIELPQGTEGVPCIVAAGADGHGMQLLVSCPLGKRGPTNIMKKDIGQISRLNKLSVFDAIGAVAENKVHEKINVNHGICNTLNKLHKNELEELKQKLYKRTIEEIGDGSQSAKRRRKFLKNGFSGSMEFVEKLEKCGNESILDEDWEVAKALIKNGLITMHTNPKLLVQAASQNRLDILIEAVASIPDLTELQFAQILKFVLSIPASSLREFNVVGGNIVSIVGDFQAYLGSINKILPVAPQQTNDFTQQLEACNSFIEAALSRNSNFSQSLLSEAFQIMDINATCILLRSISSLLFELAALRNQCCDSNTVDYSSEGYLEKAVVLVEALFDAHFLELSLKAPQDENIRRALFGVIKVVKEAEKSTACLLEATGLWSQIERVSSKNGVHIKHAVGTYQLEKLSL